MEKIYEKLRAYCSMYPYSENTFSPYPLFSAPVVMIKDVADPIYVTRENYEEVRERVTNMVIGFAKVDKDPVLCILITMSSPYRLQFLNLIADDITAKELGEHLAWCWTQTEFPHQYPIPLLTALFKRADRASMMDKEEYGTYVSLPDEIVVYRGTQSVKAKRKGMAWTLSKDKAIWFSQRWKTLRGKLYRAKVKKEDVFAYFTGRGEEEVVVNPKGLKEIEEVVV